MALETISTLLLVRRSGITEGAQAVVWLCRGAKTKEKLPELQHLPLQPVFHQILLAVQLSTQENNMPERGPRGGSVNSWCTELSTKSENPRANTKKKHCCSF